MKALLSVVVPAWNEEKVVEGLVEALYRDVLERFPEGELVVVDDHSTDETGAILDRLALQRESLRVEHSSENRGHGPSVLRGIELSTGEWVFLIDSDGQFVVSEFWELWSRREEADLLLGVRRERRDQPHRRILSLAVNAVVSLLVCRRVPDANTPFRLVRREVLDDLRPFLPDAALAPSILVTTGAIVRGRRVLEVPVTHLPRAHGGSSLATWRLVRFSLAGLAELVRFRYELARSRPPARSAETAL